MRKFSSSVPKLRREAMSKGFAGIRSFNHASVTHWKSYQGRKLLVLLRCRSPSLTGGDVGTVGQPVGPVRYVPRAPSPGGFFGKLTRQAERWPVPRAVSGEDSAKFVTIGD